LTLGSRRARLAESPHRPIRRITSRREGDWGSAIKERQFSNRRARAKRFTAKRTSASPSGTPKVRSTIRLKSAIVRRPSACLKTTAAIGFKQKARCRRWS
jgi:hypothetical protein